MRQFFAAAGSVSLSVLTLTALTGCLPTSKESSTSDCQGDDCDAVVQVNNVTSGSSVAGGSVYAAAVTVSDLGPDDADSVYVGDGTYGLNVIPFYETGGTYTPAHHTTEGTLLDGGNVTFSATALSTTTSTLEVTFTTTDATYEVVSLDPSGRFEVSGSDLLFDDNDNGTADVDIGDVVSAEDGSNNYSFEVSFNYGSLDSTVVQLLLRSLTYLHSGTGGNFTAGTRTLTVAVDEDGDTTADFSDSVTVEVTADAYLFPAVTSVAYTENDGAATLDASLLVEDTSDTATGITGATIEITSGYATGEDFIAAGSLPAGISASGSSTDDQLILTGSADIGDYQSALRGVTFENTAEDPSTASREVTVTLTDTSTNTTTTVYALSVAAVNDAPTISATSAAESTNEDTALTFNTANSNAVSIDDDDAGTDDVELELAVTDGTLTLSSTTGLTFTTGSNGDATFVVTGTVSDINTALDGLIYTPDANFNGSDTLTIDVDDQGNNGSGGALTATESIAITVNSINDAPVISATSTSEATDEGVALTFNAANSNDISIADVDVDTDDLEVQLTVSNGTLTLSSTTGLTFTTGSNGDATLVFTGTVSDINTALDGLIYTPSSGFNGSETLTIDVDDQGNNGSGGAQTASESVTITVSAVNDAPTISATSTTESTTEDTALTFNAANSNDISIADVDAGTDDVELQLSVTDGTLTLSSTTGLTFTTGSNGDATLVVTGTLSDINTALDGLIYTPDANFNGSDTLTIDVDDQGNNGSGGALTDSESIAITVNSVNDAPVISASSTSESTNEDTALTFNASNSNAISIADADAGTDDVELQLSVSDGTLTLSSTTGLTFTTGSNGDATLVVTGTVSDINTALNGLIYTPDTDFSGSDTLTIDVDDQGNNGGAAETDSESITITVSGVNDGPAISATSTAETTDEDTAITFNTTNSNDISIDDADVDTDDLELQLSVSDGTLTLSSTTGLTFTTGSNGDATLVFTGTLSDINTALDGLVYTPDTDFNGSDTLTIDIDDQGNNGSGGSLTDSESIAITVNSINDAPVITATNTSESTDEDTALTFNATNSNDISIDDADAGTDDVELELSVTDGTLTLATTATLSFSSGSNGSATFVVTGRINKINDALNGLVYTPDTGFSGTDTLTINVDDQGNNGSGGAQTASESVTISINSVNDAPVITAVSTTETTDEDTDITFNAANSNDITVADSDAASDDIELELAVTDGTLTLASTTGLTFTSGSNGDATFVVTGTVSELNTALDGLVYSPDANFNGSDTLTIDVDDQGNNGSGGALTDSESIAITVNSVNDAPVITATSTTETTDEDTAVTFNAANSNDISIADVDVDTDDLELELSVTDGTLTLASTTGLSFSSGSNGSATFVLTGTLSDINNALDGLVYTPDTGFNGSDTLAIDIDDQGNNGSGGSLTDSESITISINSVNDAPVITATSTTESTDEDIALTFNAANSNDISVADSDAASDDIELELAVSDGTLTLASTTGLTFTSGSNGAATFVVTGTVSELNTALDGLVYSPDADFNGSDTLTIDIDDQGNNGSGGALTDSESIAITVNSVNDAPVITATSTSESTDEDVALTFESANSNDISIDDTDVAMDDLELELSVTDGTLTLATTASLTFSSGSNGSATFVVVGRLDKLNNALDGLVYTPDTGFNGSDTLTINIDDQGNNGSGGALTDSESITISINSVNDAPVITATSTTESTDEDTALTFNAANSNDISVADSDAASDDIELELAVSDGTLTLASTTGLTFTSGSNGAATFVVTGTVSELNTALDGLVYSPDADFNGSDTLTIDIDDQGNNGSGGSLTDSESIAITVNSVNDAPTDLALSATNVDENSTSGTIATITVSDIDSASTGYTFTVAEGTSAVSSGGTVSTDFEVSSTGAGVHTLEVSSSADLDFETEPSIQITIEIDDGGSVNNTYSESFTITIDDTNDAPVVSTTGSGLTLTATDITEDDTSNGGDTIQDILLSDSTVTLVSEIVSDEDTDPDTLGVAIIDFTDGAYGEWEYSLDCSTFVTMADLSTAIDTTAALLLDQDDCVRFLPDGTNGEDPNPTFTFYFWDDSDGNVAGDRVDASTSGTATSIFSSESKTASIIVDDVDDEPIAYFVALDSSGSPLSGDVSVGDVITLDADGGGTPAYSYDPDEDDVICAWQWTAVSGVGSTLSPSSANNSPCKSIDVTDSADCYEPYYTSAGSTRWSLEVWSVEDGTESTNCTSSLAQISDPYEASVATENTAPTADAGDDTSFPVNYAYTLDNGADASDTETADSDLDILWEVTTIASTFSPYFELTTADELNPTVKFDAEAYTAATGSTFSTAVTVQVTLTMTVTDEGTTSGTDTSDTGTTSNAKSATDTVTLYLCLGRFADEDGDNYGNPDSYYASCSGAGGSAGGDAGLSGSSGIAQNSIDGFDCLDSGSVTDGSSTVLAADIAEYIYWYEDEDSDGYGKLLDESSGSAPDYLSGTGSTPYGDSTSDSDLIPDTCITTQPSGYVLNNDDCNDSFTITTEAGDSLLPSQQNPNTRWYNDVDGDDYGSTYSTTSRYITYNDSDDGMCHCAANCGSTTVCTAYYSDGTTENCTPADTGSCDVPSAIDQCADPGNPDIASFSYDGVSYDYYEPGTTYDFTSAGFTDEPERTMVSNWRLVDGDCDEYRDTVNEGATEVCDAADIDEDCNGYADDDEPDSSGVGSIFNFFADDDSDGYGDENDVLSSCGAAASSGRVLYTAYNIAADPDVTENNYFTNGEADADCFCGEADVSDCYDENGATCTPRDASGAALSDGDLVEVEADEVTCSCTESSCTSWCQNAAQEECVFDPEDTCTEGDSINPSWFVNFDQFDCDDTDSVVYPDSDELCDGQYNNCNDPDYTTVGAPANEVDNDNDDYVECGYVSGWSNSANEPNVGVDCSPNDSFVYPNASSYCDGQFNDCSTWDTEYADATGDCFCAEDDTCGSSSYCVDSNGDVCEPEASPTGSDVYIDDAGTCFCQESAGTDLCIDISGTVCEPSGSLTVTDFRYVDGDADCLCDSDAYGDTGSTGPSCFDLNGFSCSATTSLTDMLSLMGCAPTGDTISQGAPTNQTDADGDCYVDCYDGTTVWKGGDALLNINGYTDSSGADTCAGYSEPETGEDCDDTDKTVYPGASEVCDGQINNCNVSSLPNNESDDDGDNYVECEYDGSTWAGDGSVVGGDDCDDSYDLTFPGASETCDSEFNNCDHPLLVEMEGAVGTGCYCDDATGSSCDSCTPSTTFDTSTGLDQFVFVGDPSDTGAASGYEYAEVECYCSAVDGELDPDEDGVTDCVYSDGSQCEPADDDGDGYADNVIDNPLDATDETAIAVSLVDLGIISRTADAPFDETDNDGDKYVDCEVDPSVWLGSGLIQSGTDCDDTDRRVYPGATEYCDGQFNNCNDTDYDDDIQPSDESDGDGDGFVDCDYDGSTWAATTAAAPTGYAGCSGDETLVSGLDCGYSDCDDTDGSVYPNAEEICDNQYNDCLDSSYSTTGSPTDESDEDEDGYTVCGDDSESQDCDDTDDTIYPDAEELCDGIFNDCNHPDDNDLTGVIADVFCTDTTGASCVDIDGVSTAADSALLTIGDWVTGSDTPTVSTVDYPYALVECYCPSSQCYVDKDGDNVDDCYTPEGEVCNTPDSNPRDTLGDQCVSDPEDLSGNPISLTRTDIGADEYEYDAPSDEIDKDGDTYVECTYNASVWSDLGDRFVDGGDDCDDSVDLTGAAESTYPGATEYCDGVFNDCDDTNRTATGAPDDELDDDGDGYVDCDDPGLSILWKRPATDPELFVDEDGDCWCLSAACDGSTTCIDEDGDSCDPTDSDSSGTAECTGQASDGTAGGFSDCLDSDDTVYPGAEEICDAKYNDCDNSDYDEEVGPPDETDDDEDGFANCDGYEDTDEYDCDDDDSSRYPGAEELCDGRFNNCLHHLIDEFEGAVGTGCFCEDSDGSFSLSGGVATSCLESVNGVATACTPNDVVNNTTGASSSDQIIDNFVTLQSITPEVIDSTDHFAAEVECYCPTSECTVDIDLDGYSDCYTPDGDRCEIEDIDTDDDGVADNCISDPLNAGATADTNLLSIDSPSLYTLDGSGALGAPPDEYDNDGDRYVECTYSASIWEGPAIIRGGDDCDDVNDWSRFVYPTATEYCDGVLNDCDDVVDEYDDRDAPADESDDDGDGWVECSNSGTSWRWADTDPNRYVDESGTCFCPAADSDGLCDYDNSSSDEDDNCLDANNEICTPSDVDGNSLTSCTANGGYEDCDDEDEVVYPYADELCDGQYNDCEDSDWAATGAPDDEVDEDGDGYVECDNAEGADWAGDADEPDGYDDCANDDASRYPGGEELCDGVFNDCTNDLLLDFAGVTHADCFCPSADGETDADGDGVSDCVNSDGDTCDPIDEDGDLVMDHFLATTKTIDGLVYNSGEYNAACLCEADDGTIDTDSDGVPNCVDLTGQVCSPTESGSTNVMASFEEISRTVNGVEYLSVETVADEACYCPDDGCIVDLDFNEISDCYTISGDICHIDDIDEDDSGVADSCMPVATGFIGPVDPATSVEVVFANPTGLSVDTDAPPDEIDDDGDRYVECSYSSSIWKGNALVRDGDDCDDIDNNGEAAFVYPGASEYCDGVFNNCNGYDSDGDGTVDESYVEGSAPSTEIDGDGDNFVDCDPNAGISWKVDATNPNPFFAESDYDSSDPYRVVYVDVAGTCFCNEVEDANNNSFGCAGTCVDADGNSCVPDTSADCSPYGGYSDCLDTRADNGALTHVDATEICDAQFNDCRDVEGLGYDPGDPDTYPDRDTANASGEYENVPDAERDDDGDGRVDCLEDEGLPFSSSYWLGYGSASVTDGEDCDDTNAAIYNHAAETCDGVFNDCDDPQIQVYYGGVSADCYCVDQAGSSCVNSAGASCFPSSYDDIVELSETVTIGIVDFGFAEVSHYCQSSTCTLDVDNDGYEDCAEPDGTRATTLSAADASANCLGVAIAEFTFGGNHPVFTSYDGTDADSFIDAPYDETDLDGDGYVDCDGAGYTGSGWEGNSDEPEVGWDCSGDDNTVYPNADEVCDGQYNDCNDYSSFGAPADETDDDEDGWIECERDDSVPWRGDDPEPNLWYGDLDDDCWCPSETECDNVSSSGTASVGRCINEDSQRCVPTTCEDTTSPSTTSNDFRAIEGQPLVDCDDDSAFTFPGASPMEADDDAQYYSTVLEGIDAWECTNDDDGDFYADSDVEGDVVAGSDCNDDDDGVHPYQQETCEDSDQVDDDCNGDPNSADGFNTLNNPQVDLYVDEDTDTYGDPDVGTVEACELVDGYSSNGQDCDDTDDAIYPGAPEVCDLTDQDCDGQVDEPDLDPETSGCREVFLDNDGDTYGNADISDCLCLYDEDTSTVVDGDTYVLVSGDCYDYDDTIKPRTCDDDADNDEDGDIDENDADCAAGYDESGTVLEEKIEIIDGHDNDCDGQIPAIELDCDDDGYMARMPIEDSFTLTNSSEYRDYDDLGLGVCGTTPGATQNITCWGQQIRVECDAPVIEIDEDGVRVTGSGLWMLNYDESKGSYDGRFDGGHREYEVSRTLKTFDCDDQCDDRYPNANEECDQIDNNCSVDSGGDDGGANDATPGIPDALDADVVIEGTISIAELDLDSDNFLSCEDLPSITAETQYTTVNCDSETTVDDTSEDCEIFCSLANPNGVGSDGERCDGLLNVCDSDVDMEGSDDTDRDNYRECGAYGSDGNSLPNEDIYVVVWLKDIDWARRGSEEVELARSDRGGREGSLRTAAATGDASDTADSGLVDSGVVDSGAADSGVIPPPPADSGVVADTGGADGGSDDSGDAGSSESSDDGLADFVPLLVPRTDTDGNVIACDEQLYEQLSALLGQGVVDAAIEEGNGTESSRTATSELLLEACTSGEGDCTVVRASYSEDADERTYDDYIVQPGAFTGECEDHPEQWISRAVWQHDRILEARQTVIGLECLRLFGENCSELDTSATLVTDWQDGLASAERHLAADDSWWIELDRFETSTAHTETFLTCWGDPRDSTDTISDQTGGDCDDSAETGDLAHRDLPEGPDDLLGLYLNAPADCSTCLDGVDNNCDGNIDCADPACARCFIGQGVGCSRGDTPCAQAGCSIGAPEGGAFIDRFFAAAVLALFAVLFRRRERR